MKRIWYHPDGIAVTHIQGGSSRELDSEGAKLLAAGRSYAAAPHEDFQDDEILAFLPPDRSQRNKWRKNPAGRGVWVDPTVPDPPRQPAQQARLDQIARATTVAELKAILTDIVKG